MHYRGVINVWKLINVQIENIKQNYIETNKIKEL